MKFPRLLPLFLLAVTALAEPAPPIDAEVCVYGGTPSGVMAAVAAARLGHTVSLVDINAHTGGVVSGGLVATDMGDRKTVGGLADEFFLRIVRHYRDKFGDDSPQLKACRNGYTFEPHVAEAVFDAMLAEQPRVRVFHRLRYRSVAMERELPSSRQEDRPAASLEARAPRVASLTVEDPKDGAMRTFTAKVFIDASYEGDVMAGAHVPYRVGRESRAEFGEYLAGVNMGPKEQRGLGDHRTMAYNYRVSATLDTANRVLFPKPEHYDPTPFIATHGKRIKEGHVQSFGDFFTTLEKAHPGAKYDVNWFDFPGDSEGYADGSWETRDRIAARIRDHAQSLLYYMQNDPELPEAFRTASRAWGLPKDEFADNGHWPFQLYVREGRRMLGRTILREQDLTQDRWKADGIATGGYGVDCHVVQMIREGGRVVSEHTRHVACNNYDIPYASLTPPDVENLLVPVCCSTTHVAYCSLRMEPVFMMLGHAAGDAAHLALAEAVSVQKVDTEKLRALLRKENAVLDAGYQPQAKISVTPAHPKPGERAVLKVIASPQNKDAFTKIAWDFDGNGKVSAGGERVVQAFALEKTYTVSALITDATGRRRLLTTELPVGTAVARDVTVDDFDAEDFGRWDGTFPDYIPGLPLRYSDIFLGPGIHRDVTRKGTKSPARIRFQPTLPRAGKYQICLGFRPAKNQATNVPVTIRHASGTAKLTVNERDETTPFNFTPVGEFTFKAGDSGFVEIANANTDGRVVIDGVRWVWLGE